MSSPRPYRHFAHFRRFRAVSGTLENLRGSGTSPREKRAQKTARRSLSRLSTSVALSVVAAAERVGEGVVEEV